MADKRFTHAGAALASLWDRLNVFGCAAEILQHALFLVWGYGVVCPPFWPKTVEMPISLCYNFFTGNRRINL